MKLAETLKEYIEAAFTGLWVETLEPDEAKNEIAFFALKHDIRLLYWDAASGTQTFHNGLWEPNPGDGPLAPINALKALADPQGLKTTICLLRHYHRFLDNPLIQETMLNQILHGRGTRAFIVVLSPIVNIPRELEKFFVVIEHQLPDHGELRTIAESFHQEDGKKVDDKSVDSATGLIRYEAEGAFALSKNRHDHIVPDDVWGIKAGMIKKSGLLEVRKSEAKFKDIVGLQAIKNFCVRALAPGDIRPRGLLLLGVPGTGKTFFSEALGNEVGLPTLFADPGSWKASHVGETGAKTRQAFKIARAMAPAILFIDEIEKAFAGATGYQGDSGVSSDQLGVVLKELTDNDNGELFFIATCNDISKLPPELSRQERFDAIFFLDLLGPQERDAMWRLYINKYKLEGQDIPNCDNWTGAEIKGCCHTAAMLAVNLTEAAKYVVPVAQTYSDKIQSLREWASGRCVDASAGGIYYKDRQVQTKSNRRVVRKEEAHV